MKSDLAEQLRASRTGLIEARRQLQAEIQGMKCPGLDDTVWLVDYRLLWALDELDMAMQALRELKRVVAASTD